MIQFDWHQANDTRATVFVVDDNGQEEEHVATTKDPKWAEKIVVALNLEAKIRQEIEITA